MAANMICVYYDQTAVSRELFEHREFAQAQMPEGKRWDAYLGRFDVIRLVITDFLEGSTCVDELLAYLTEEVWDELKEAYPEIYGRDDVLSLLVHLGYLGYDAGRGEVFIPNREILEAFRTSTNGSESESDFVQSHSGK